MTVFQVFKKFAYHIGVLGLLSGIVGAVITWSSISPGRDDQAMASNIGDMMIFLVVLIPLGYLGLCYLELDVITTVKRNTVAMGLGIVGLLGGAFASSVYFYIGFQLPTLFLEADMFIVFDTLVPALFSTGLIVIVLTMVVGVGFGIWRGQTNDSTG